MSDLSAEQFYRHGCEQLARGEVAGACEAFARSLAACPDALDDLSAAFGTRAAREEALAALERTPENLERLPENLEWLPENLECGSHATAFAPANSVCRSAPAGSMASGGKAVAWLPHSKLLAAARQALSARLARDLGRLDDAVSFARRAVEAEPSRAAWWYELGEIRRAQGNTREASAAYRRCVALQPDHGMARLALSVTAGRSWKRLARFLTRFRRVHHFVRRMAWTPRTLEALEKHGNTIAANQFRWAHALEGGSAVPLFLETPPDLKPDRFESHWKECRCLFWQWFLELGIEKEVRSVLDVGCGTGYQAQHFARHGCEAAGATVNPYEQEECRQRGLGIIPADFHFLPVPDGRYDLVFSSHSLEHSAAPLFALLEWKRVLRRGGYLMVITPMPVERDTRAAFPDYYVPETDSLILFPENLRYYEAQAACSTYNNGLHVFVLSYWQLLWLFRLAGFERVAESLEGFNPPGQVGVEHVDGRLPRDPNYIVNGMFLLRKPAAEP